MTPPPGLRKSGKARIIRKDDVLEIELGGLRGSDFADALDKVKAIAGRRFDSNPCPYCNADEKGCSHCWKGERKIWLLEATPENAERVLYSIQPEADQELIEWIRDQKAQRAEDLTTPLPNDAKLKVTWDLQREAWQPEYIEVADEKIPFNGLLKHQRPAVDLLAREGRAILADDMGLGKTGTIISAVEEWRLRQAETTDGTLPSGPRLVICPNSVKGVWAREVKMWLGPDTSVVIVNASSAKARHNQIEKALESDENVWIVVNYEQVRAVKRRIETKTKVGSTLRKTVEEMKEPLFETTDWLLVVADEIHRAKNRKAQTTRGLWRCRGSLMFGTTGTPVMNRPDELWAQLAWLWPDDYHERGSAHRPGARAFWQFYEQYTDYTEGYWGKEIIGVKNPDALRFELKNRVVRRTAGEVLDLPGRVRIGVPIMLNPGQRKLYEEATIALWLEVMEAAQDGDASAQEFLSKAEEGAHGSSLYRIPNGAARTVRLRQIIETPYCLGGPDDSAVLDACVERITDTLPAQWAVFCEFKPTTECLIDRLEKLGISAAAYTGDVDSDVRTELENEYQRGEISVLVGTIKAMYQGITLTAGHNQFWVSRSWNPKENEQGEARQDRMGQQKRVMVFIAQPEQTVATSKVAPTNRLKERIARAIMPEDHIEEVILS